MAIRLLMSRTSLTEKLYGDKIIDEYAKNYSVNIRNRFKSVATHILVANYTTNHKMNISYYGGISTIVPIPLSIFQKMVEDSYKASYIPQPHQVKRFFERSNEIAATSSDKKIWYQEITNEALNWLG